ncbi:lycopene cyclase domain-containing protein [Demequina sp.]|uniref:lycopene cyclase domain-containing protein n=1 Tax=Demequina sp. TaxID=2050685 RepID=UPI0025D10B35|nr:lycopene cyclase domain-containing protein [Demequina sp.]
MTYVVLSVAVLAIIAAVTVPTLRRLPHRPILLTGLVLIALTAVFDNVIVGLGIVAYDDAHISGVRVGAAPIEDFSYTLGAVMLIPAVWTWLTRRDREAP